MKDRSTLKLRITSNGDVISVYSDYLAVVLQTGNAEVKRASHVEPSRDPEGRPCWYADLSPVGGPEQLGPFYTRKEALDTEVKWLEEHIVWPAV